MVKCIKKKGGIINKEITQDSLYLAQAIKVNGMVYTSGSLPVIPDTGNYEGYSINNLKKFFFLTLIR